MWVQWPQPRMWVSEHGACLPGTQINKGSRTDAEATPGQISPCVPVRERFRADNWFCQSCNPRGPAAASLQDGCTGANGAGSFHICSAFHPVLDAIGRKTQGLGSASQAPRANEGRRGGEQGTSQDEGPGAAVLRCPGTIHLETLSLSSDPETVFAAYFTKPSWTHCLT